jgi:hypothetical protein
MVTGPAMPAITIIVAGIMGITTIITEVVLAR